MVQLVHKISYLMCYKRNLHIVVFKQIENLDTRKHFDFSIFGKTCNRVPNCTIAKPT